MCQLTLEAASSSSVVQQLLQSEDVPDKLPEGPELKQTEEESGGEAK
jgi:hypothetical protein